MMNPIRLSLLFLLLSETFLSADAFSTIFDGRSRKTSASDPVRAETGQNSDTPSPDDSSIPPRSNGWSSTPNVIGPDQWINSVSLSRSPNYFPQSWSGSTQGRNNDPQTKRAVNSNPYWQSPSRETLSPGTAARQTPEGHHSPIQHQNSQVPSQSASSWTNAAYSNGAMNADVIKKVGLNEYQSTNPWNRATAHEARRLQAEAEIARVAEEARNARLLAEENVKRLKAEAAAEAARLAQEQQKAAAEEEERARLAAEQEEKQRIAAEEEERARLAAEQEEKQRIAAEEAERARLTAAEEAERARLAAEQEEKQRIAAEEAERARLTAEAEEKQRIAAEEEERARLAAEAEEKQRIAAEEEERAQSAAEAEEKQRIAAEEEERARLAAEAEEKQRIAAEEEERARLAAEAEEKQRIAAEEEERSRLAAEAEEKQRIAAEEEERARLAAEAEEKQRIAAEEVERARLAAEAEEKQRIAAEEKERAQLAAEQKEKQRIAAVEADAVLMAEKARNARMLAEESVRKLKSEAKAEASRVAKEKQKTANLAAAKQEESTREQQKLADLAAAEGQQLRLVAELKEKRRVTAGVEEARSLTVQADAEAVRMAEKARNARLLAEENVRRLKAEAKAEAFRVAQEQQKAAHLATAKAEQIRLTAERVEKRRDAAAEEDERSRIAAEQEAKRRIAAAEKEERVRKVVEQDEKRRITAAKDEERSRKAADQEEERRIAAEEKEARRLTDAEAARMAEKARNARLLAEEKVRKLKAEARAAASRVDQEQQKAADLVAAEEERILLAAEQAKEERKFRNPDVSKIARISEEAKSAHDEKAAATCLAEEENERDSGPSVERKASFLRGREEGGHVRVAPNGNPVGAEMGDMQRRPSEKQDIASHEKTPSDQYFVNNRENVDTAKNNFFSKVGLTSGTSSKVKQKDRRKNLASLRPRAKGFAPLDQKKTKPRKAGNGSKVKELQPSPAVSQKANDQEMLQNQMTDELRLREMARQEEEAGIQAGKVRAEEEVGLSAIAKHEEATRRKLLQYRLSEESRLREMARREEEARIQAEKLRAEEEARLSAIAKHEEATRRGLLQYRLSEESRLREIARREEEALIKAEQDRLREMARLEAIAQFEAQRKAAEVARKEEEARLAALARSQEVERSKQLARERELARRPLLSRIEQETRLNSRPAGDPSISPLRTGKDRNANMSNQRVNQTEPIASMEIPNCTDAATIQPLVTDHSQSFDVPKNMTELSQAGISGKSFAGSLLESIERGQDSVKQDIKDRHNASLSEPRPGQKVIDPQPSEVTRQQIERSFSQKNSKVQLTAAHIIGEGEADEQRTEAKTMVDQEAKSTSKSNHQENALRKMLQYRLLNEARLKESALREKRSIAEIKNEHVVSMDRQADTWSEAVEREHAQVSAVTTTDEDKNLQLVENEEDLSNKQTFVNARSEGREEKAAIARHQESRQRALLQYRLSNKAQLATFSFKKEDARIKAKNKDAVSADRPANNGSEAVETEHAGVTAMTSSDNARNGNNYLQLVANGEDQSNEQAFVNVTSGRRDEDKLDVVARRRESRQRALLQHRLSNKAGLTASSPLKENEMDHAAYSDRPAHMGSEASAGAKHANVAAVTASTYTQDEQKYTVNNGNLAANGATRSNEEAGVAAMEPSGKDKVATNALDEESRQRALLQYRLPNKTHSATSSTETQETTTESEKKAKAEQAEAEARAALELAESILSSIDETEVTTTNRKGASFVGSLLTNIERSKETGKLTIQVARGVFNIVRDFFKEIRNDEEERPAVETVSDSDWLVKQKEENARIAAEAARMAEEAARLEAARLKKIEEAIEERRKMVASNVQTKTMKQHEEKIEHKQTKRPVPFFASIKATTESR